MHRKHPKKDGFSTSHFKILHKRDSVSTPKADEMPLEAISSKSMLNNKELRKDSILLNSAPVTIEVASVVPTVVGATPHSKLLQCERGDSKVPDNSVLLKEERLPSSQKKEDTGHDTKLQASEREVETSKVDEKRSKPVPMPSPDQEPAMVTSVPVAFFGKHVEMKHGNNNQPFISEFSVRYDYIDIRQYLLKCNDVIHVYMSFVQSLTNGKEKSVSVARSPQNKKKNRFANISTCKYLHDLVFFFVF